MINTENSVSVSSSIWKISNGQNGDKYLTFSDDTRRSNRIINESNDEHALINQSIRTVKLYKMRWYILLVICLANISNAFNWINYSSIADYTGEFYSVGYDSVNFLSLIYLIVAIPAGFLSSWLIDNFGIRTSINIGAWLNCIGSFVRVLSSIDSADGKPLFDTNYKYTVLMVGQCMCAAAQPFIMFVTTKFANNWFSEDQRALANTIALGSNTVGILIGAFVSPLVVDSSVEFVSEMCLLNLIAAASSILPAFLACFINRSMPLSPPSYSALLDGISNANSTDLQESVTFGDNLRAYFAQVSKLLKSKDFLILFFSFGVSLGTFNAFTTLIEQIICTRGYSDNDAGYFGGAMIVSGIVGSIIAGVLLDKTKRFEEIAKICFAMCALANILFVIIQLNNNDHALNYYLILLSFCLIGFFGLPLLPVCMEMSVECVYPIPEATSTGLLFIGGQIVGVVMILFYPKLATPIDANSYVYNSIQTCTAGGSSSLNTTTPAMGFTSTIAPSGSSQLTVLDFRNPLYGQSFILVFISITFTLFFKCAYLRLRSERERLAEQILNSARTSS
jgi:FLVCR family MFS transporter 7